MKRRWDALRNHVATCCFWTGSAPPQRKLLQISWATDARIIDVPISLRFRVEPTRAILINGPNFKSFGSLDLTYRNLTSNNSFHSTRLR